MYYFIFSPGVNNMMKPLPGHKALDHREIVRQKVLHGRAISRITQTSHSFHLFPKPIQNTVFSYHSLILLQTCIEHETAR